MKKNIILFVILFVISGLYFGINYLNDSSREKNNTSNIDISFNDFSYDKIKSENIEINDNKIVYTGTGEFEQDNEKVNKFIDDIKNTKVLSLVSTNKDNFDNFGLNNTGSVLNIGNSKIFLGNTKGWIGEQYIRLAGLDKVFLINKDLTSFLNKGFDFFKKEGKVNSEAREGALGQKIEDKADTGTGETSIGAGSDNNN